MRRRARCYGLRGPSNTRLALTGQAPLPFQRGWGQNSWNTESLDRVCLCLQGVVPSDGHWRSGVLTGKQSTGPGNGGREPRGIAQAGKLSRSPVPMMWLADVSASLGTHFSMNTDQSWRHLLLGLSVCSQCVWAARNAN